MRDGIPSFTALAVAFARGVDDVDPIAESLMPFPLGALVRAAHRAQSRRPLLRQALRSGSLAAHLPLRTLAIDAVVADAVARGARQLVVLGAGLDARAWRMPELADVLVFEVDHPATQRYKAARIRNRRPTCREVRFVPVDFAKDDLVARLLADGFAADAPVVFVWEGVTMYLPRAATESTLAALVRLSGGSATVAMTYATPRLAGGVGAIRPLVRAAFGLLGEPLRGLMGRGEITALVNRAGMRVVQDSGPREWAVAAGRRSPWLRVAERLLVASV